MSKEQKYIQGIASITFDLVKKESINASSRKYNLKDVLGIAGI